jgi:hypothetical protein
MWLPGNPGPPILTAQTLQAQRWKVDELMILERNEEYYLDLSAEECGYKDIRRLLYDDV